DGVADFLGFVDVIACRDYRDFIVFVNKRPTKSNRRHVPLAYRPKADYDTLLALLKIAAVRIFYYGRVKECRRLYRVFVSEVRAQQQTGIVVKIIIFITRFLDLRPYPFAVPMQFPGDISMPFGKILQNG